MEVGATLMNTLFCKFSVSKTLFIVQKVIIRCSHYICISGKEILWIVRYQHWMISSCVQGMGMENEWMYKYYYLMFFHLSEYIYSYITVFKNT